MQINTLLFYVSSVEYSLIDVYGVKSIPTRNKGYLLLFQTILVVTPNSKIRVIT